MEFYHPREVMSAFMAAMFVTLAFSQSFNGMQSYTPVIDPVSKTILCVTDPPSAVVPLADVSVGVPVGVPDAVVCGLCCTGQSGCISYNYRQTKSTPAQCELFNTPPKNCSTSKSDSDQCQHYEVSGARRSCSPPPGIVTTVPPTTTVTTTPPPTTSGIVTTVPPTTTVPSTPPPTTSGIVTTVPPTTTVPTTPPPTTSGVVTTILPTTTTVRTTQFPTTIRTTTSACRSSGGIEYGGNCYFFSDHKRKQADAENYCTAWGGHLTSITDDYELNFIKTNSKSTDVWIGLMKPSPDYGDVNTFNWLDSSTSTFQRDKSNWSDNEPDEKTTCIRISNGQFRDRACDNDYNFDCKKPIPNL